MNQQNVKHIIERLIYRYRISAYPAAAIQINDLLQSLEVLENGDLVLNLEALAVLLYREKISASASRINLRTGK